MANSFKDPTLANLSRMMWLFCWHLIQSSTWRCSWFSTWKCMVVIHTTSQILCTKWCWQSARSPLHFSLSRITCSLYGCCWLVVLLLATTKAVFFFPSLFFPFWKVGQIGFDLTQRAYSIIILVVAIQHNFSAGFTSMLLQAIIHRSRALANSDAKVKYLNIYIK